MSRDVDAGAARKSVHFLRRHEIPLRAPPDRISAGRPAGEPSPRRRQRSGSRPESPAQATTVSGGRADLVEVRHDVRLEQTLLPELVIRRTAGCQESDSSGGDVDPAGRIDLAGHGVTLGQD